MAGRNRNKRIQGKNRISVTFPQEDYDEIVRLAKRKRVSLAWIVREALGRYLMSGAPLFHPPPVEEQ